MTKSNGVIAWQYRYVTICKYVSTPMQVYGQLIVICFVIFSANIDCEYSLDTPQLSWF